jgi:hypothetical protein
MPHPTISMIVVRACAATAAAGFASTAWAATGDAPDARVAAARSLFRAENAVSAGEPAKPRARLEEQRGGTDTRNDMRLDGSVSSNTAVNVVTGSNRIDTGSFANMSGIPVVIQNSGANVLIQNATIINLQYK